MANTIAVDQGSTRNCHRAKLHAVGDKRIAGHQVVRVIVKVGPNALLKQGGGAGAGNARL